MLQHFIVLSIKRRDFANKAHHYSSVSGKWLLKKPQGRVCGVFYINYDVTQQKITKNKPFRQIWALTLAGSWHTLTKIKFDRTRIC
jgi:hypothetical protein